ncbi:amidase [Nocardioides sp. MH1]|uniref:amidase n=1 Tax=Nocardioides sp. MH1 TaxID=3242490 RepID=UPI003520E9C5
MTRVHAYGDDALGDLDAVGLVERLRAGEVSIPEVVEAAIARTEQVAGDLGAVAHADFARARRTARDPHGGYFAGVPTYLKDNVDVAGWPTMSGTDAWAPRAAKKDGDLARMYLATGLIPLGKTRLSEYGFSPSCEHPRLGPVRSPWDTARTAGASSAGSAALVAAGAVPIAHGNDGGGSIRIPASINGLVGLKPTRGRLAQDAVIRQQPIAIVADGVLTRSVRDTAAFLREAEQVFRPLQMPPIGDLTRPGRKRLRIALNTTGVERGADAEVTALTEEVARLLEDLGHTVVEAEAPVPATFREDFLLYWASLALALLSGGRRLHGRSWVRAHHDNLTEGLASHAKRHLHRLPGAMIRLRRSTREAALFFERYDVALTPTLAHPTPAIGYLDPTQDYAAIVEKLYDWVAFTPLYNVTGTPAVSLPLATASNGLPQGMMFGAGWGREAVLLELGYELEQARPWARIQD